MSEPPPLVIARRYPVTWRKPSVDLNELAKLRFKNQWTVEHIAKHMGIGTTTVKRYLRDARKGAGYGKANRVYR